MDLTDGEYKTAVQTLEVFRMQREMRFDTAYKVPSQTKHKHGASVYSLAIPTAQLFFL